jgi:enolase-phosphatase E1
LASPFDPAAIRAILLDIEGTTTPVDFVYGTLFPYARARMRAFLEAYAAQPEVAAEIAALRREHASDVQRTPAPPPWPDEPERNADRAAAYALWLMDQDRKSTPLKSLQGRIWKAGYTSGELRGQLYPDVPPALARWKQQGRRIAIFSSGSVQAQQLLFRHSAAGDLTPHIDAYFDTTTGPKQEPESYRRIAAALELPPQSFFFISDVAAELDAARAADMVTAFCQRPGTSLPGHPNHPVLQHFDSVLP